MFMQGIVQLMLQSTVPGKLELNEWFAFVSSKEQVKCQWGSFPTKNVPK